MDSPQLYRETKYLYLLCVICHTTFGDAALVFYVRAFSNCVLMQLMRENNPKHACGTQYVHLRNLLSCFVEFLGVGFHDLAAIKLTNLTAIPSATGSLAVVLFIFISVSHTVA